MKIPFSVRSYFEQHKKDYCALKALVEPQIEAIRDTGWHYVGRLKTSESFAQKLETGRFTKEEALTDLFACTLVVERADRIKEAEAKLRESFDVRARKPEKPEMTPHRAMCFDFDYVRLYASLKRDKRTPASGYEHLVFEIQIKTFLQHAWTIATHDLIYKTDTIDWEASRVAYQIKAMLEHAEASITAVKAISQTNEPARSNKESLEQQNVIAWLQRNWGDQLPKDVVRLAECVRNLQEVAGINLTALSKIFDTATKAGNGSKTLNLSPFSSIVDSVLSSPEGLDALEAASKRRIKNRILVPAELEFPTQSDKIEKLLYRIQ